MSKFQVLHYLYTHIVKSMSDTCARTHTRKHGNLNKKQTFDRKDPQLELSDDASKLTKLKAISVIRGMLRTLAEN